MASTMLHEKCCNTVSQIGAPLNHTQCLKKNLNAPRPSEQCYTWYMVANPVRGLLDRKISEEHIQSSNESKRKTQTNMMLIVLF